jgi:hypothetical protein
VESGKILEKVKIEGAQFLNDVTVDKNAVIYVSDSRTGKVHKVFGGKAEVFLEDLKGPNGLLALDDNLYLLDNGVFYEVELDDKEMKKIAEGIEGGSDGIERVEGKEFIVSSWSGVVYYVDDDGNKEKLLDTREQKINSADIGYDAKNRVVYVPTFWKKSIVAYRLE